MLLIVGFTFAAEPAPAPGAALVSTPVTADPTGPFVLRVDPFVVARVGEATTVSIRITAPGQTRLYQDQVSVEVKDPKGFVLGTLVLPPAESYHDPFTSADRAVYRGETEFLLPITASPGMKGRVDLTVDVSWQGCSDNTCYMPASQSFNVPVRVKAA